MDVDRQHRRSPMSDASDHRRSPANGAADGCRARLDYLRRLEWDSLTAPEPEAFASRVLEELHAVVPSRWSAVLHVRSSGDEAVVLAAQGEERLAGAAALRAGLRVPLRLIPTIDRLRRGRVTLVTDLVQDTTGDPLVEVLQHQGLRALMAVPIGAPEDFFGILVLSRGGPGRFSRSELDLARDTALRLSTSLREERRQHVLREAERRYRQLFHGIPIGLFQAATSGRLLDVNGALVELLGYPDAETLLTRSIDGLFAEQEKWVAARTFMDRVGLVRDVELPLRRFDGELLWGLVNARVVRDEDGNIVRHEGSLQDVTDRRRAEDRLLHDALHDSLTGLPNRAFFLERLKHTLEQSRRVPSYRFGVIFLDLDRFKMVNDSLGHQAGDQVLITAADRIRGSVRGVDSVARLSGDEFAVLLDGVHDLWDALRVVERLEEDMRTPFLVDEQELFLTASIGLALSEDDYERPEDLLRDADIAMYRAKSRGRGGHVVFDAGMQRRVASLLRLETELRRALDRGELRLHYQPIVRVDTGQTVALEALVRWQHPRQGLLLPPAFIQAAEDSGMVVPLGYWALEQACRQMHAWRREFPTARPLQVSVNVSARQFLHPSFYQEVQRVLKDSGLEPQALRLELTETVVMEDPVLAAELLGRLRRLGVGLAVDDFGSGYSSLGMLRRCAFDMLKTDGSFAQKEEWEHGGREIVKAVLSLAQTLGLDVVVEGIERVEQVEELQAWGVRQAQGFYYSRPLGAAAARAMIALGHGGRRRDPAA